MTRTKRVLDEPLISNLLQKLRQTTVKFCIEEKKKDCDAVLGNNLYD